VSHQRFDSGIENAGTPQFAMVAPGNCRGQRATSGKRCEIENDCSQDVLPKNEYVLPSG